MAITEFHKPQKVQHQQSYVDQYVPMPFEIMQKAAQNRQDVADKNELQAEASISSILDMQAIDHEALGGNQNQMKNERIQEYENKLENIVSSYNGDMSLASKDIRKLAREIHSDKTRGDLAHWQGNYDARQAEQERINKAIERKDLIGETGRQHMTSSMDGFQATGNYTGQDYTAHFDKNKLLQDWASKVKESGGMTKEGLQYKIDPSGQFQIFEHGEWKGVGKDRAIDIATNALAGSQEYQAEKDYLGRIGYIDDTEQASIDTFMDSVAHYFEDPSLQIKTFPGAGSKNKRTNLDYINRTTVPIANPTKAQQLKDDYGSTIAGEVGGLFEVYTRRGDGKYDKKSIENLVNQAINNGHEVNADGSAGGVIIGEDKTSYDSSSRYGTPLERTKGIVNGNIPLPEGLTTDERFRLLSGLNEVVKRQDAIQNQRQEYANELLYSGDPESIGLSEKELTNFKGYRQERLGMISAYGDLIKNNRKKYATDNEADRWISENQKRFKNKRGGAVSLTQAIVGAPSRVRETILEREKLKNNEFELSKKYQDVQSKINDYIEEKYESEFTSSEVTLIGRPEIDDVNLPEGVSARDASEDIHEKIVSKVNSKSGAHLQGRTLSGTPIKLDDIKYSANEEGDIVKDFNAELDVEYTTTKDGFRQIVASGYNEEGVYTKVVIPLSNFGEIATSTYGGDLLSESSLDSRAMAYIGNSRDRDIQGKTKISNDYESMPDNLRLSVDPNYQVEGSSLNADAGISFVISNDYGGETALDLTAQEKLALMRKSIENQDKLNREFDWNKRQELLYKQKSEMDEIIKIISERGNQEIK